MADNTTEFFFSAMELKFFQLQYMERNHCVLSSCVCAKLKIFLSAEKISEVDYVLKGDLQDKAMQEISKAMNNVLRKVGTRVYSGITNSS